jgi:AcrR family transcriptional regulator
VRQAERRAHLLHCALEVFARKGYHAASIADIIKQASVARGTFYLYFESKRAVFEELLDELLAALDTRVKRIDPSRGPSGVLAQMEANIDDVVDYLLSNRSILRVLLCEAVGLDSGFDQKLSEFYGHLLDMIQQALDNGKEMKIVAKKVHTQVAALCILGSIKEVLYQEAMGSNLPPREALVVEILRYNVRALLVPDVADKLRA